MSGLIRDALVALAVCCAVFGSGWLSGRASNAAQVERITAQSQQADAQAQARLIELTQERDEQQRKIDDLYKIQEAENVKAQDDIKRLSDELASRPIRVRIQPGACGGSATGQAPASAGANPEDPGPAYGLLPEENLRRLNSILTEIETVSAAYRSCRALILED